VQGLTDRSRRPYRYVHQLPFQGHTMTTSYWPQPPSCGPLDIFGN
jgi:hypothetical protein